MLAVSSSGVSAQGLPGLNVPAAVEGDRRRGRDRELGNAAMLAKPAVAATTAVTLGNGNILQAQPAQSVTLYADACDRKPRGSTRRGWPLYALVDRFGVGAALDEEANCLAVAVYYEARGESLEGQLAVARVIMNRAKSGKYPSELVRDRQAAVAVFFRQSAYGQFPRSRTSSTWRKAQGVARMAIDNVVPSVRMTCSGITRLMSRRPGAAA